MGKQLAVITMALSQVLLAGSVCVAPVAKPNDGVKSLSNPSGGNKIQQYTVQIDGLKRIEVAADHGVSIDGIETAGRHSVKIMGDGKAVTAFHFQFSQYSSRDLCLWMKPLYETWSLTEAKGHGRSCVCK